jgi:Zn-dependent M28 family amino/carboxypeptidase
MVITLIVVLTLAAVAVFGLRYLTRMPEPSTSPQARTLAPLSPGETETAARLRSHVKMLAGEIGGRDATHIDNLNRAAAYIEQQLRQSGYSPARQSYQAGDLTFHNIDVQLSGAAEPGSIVLIGAHYDTAGGNPGANDNGSGVAATLELARQFAGHPQSRSLRFVFFTDEEPPYFQTRAMGSLVYSGRSKELGEKILAMLSLETIGYYSEQPGSQRYPDGLGAGLPNRGNFLGFVVNVQSAPLLRRVIGTFRGATTLPAEGVAAPSIIPGVGWSDHWSFWQAGYPALMVTDTAPYRYPWYHSESDTPDKLDYDRLARAITGLSAAIKDLAGR